MDSRGQLRLTKPTLAVLDVLSNAALESPVWGLRISELADLGSGTVYPILERLTELGWIESWREADQPAGRPRRRYYRLTSNGRSELAEALHARAHRRGWSRLRPVAGTS